MIKKLFPLQKLLNSKLIFGGLTEAEEFFKVRVDQIFHDFNFMNSRKISRPRKKCGITFNEIFFSKFPVFFFHLTT